MIELYALSSFTTITKNHRNSNHNSTSSITNSTTNTNTDITAAEDDFRVKKRTNRDLAGGGFAPIITADACLVE